MRAPCAFRTFVRKVQTPRSIKGIFPVREPAGRALQALASGVPTAPSWTAGPLTVPVTARGTVKAPSRDSLSPSAPLLPATVTSCTVTPGSFPAATLIASEATAGDPAK